jgi:DNA ligase D-like protein (predicted ligase)
MPTKRKGLSQAGTRPVFVTPMAAQLVEELPDGPEWLYELKLDGYRALLLKDAERVQIRSRNDNDLTRTYPMIVAAARRLKPKQIVLDGEIVAVDKTGRPSFQAMQHRGASPGFEIMYYAFDLLNLDGAELMSVPLEERRAALPALIEGTGLRLSPDLPGSAVEVIAAVRGLGLEGVVAKRRDSIYEPGERSSAWRKVKLQKGQEFVIGGYRPDGETVDALIVGYYDDGDELRFAAKVRAGLVPHVRRSLLKQLRPLRIETCPFVDLPSPKTSRWGGGVSKEDMRVVTWIKPQFVAQIAFTEWTNDGRLRASSFVGMREDKIASHVRREGRGSTSP